MPKAASLLRLLLAVGLAGVLAACASTTPPPEPDYVLEVEGQLDPDQYDPGAVFWAQALTNFAADWSATYGWYEPSFPVEADGSYEISIDAREFPGDPLTPEEFGTRHLFPFGDDVLDVTVSNPNAKLRVLNRISLYQSSPAQGYLAHSHNLFHTQKAQYGGTTYSYFGTLVFSDVAVNIDASANVPGLDPHRVLDLDLVPGWNLVHFTPSETPGLSRYESKPLGSQQTSLSVTTANLGSRDTSPPASELSGYSVFAAHQVQADAVTAEMYAGLYPYGTSILRAHNWYGSVNDPASFLVPFLDALPFGDTASGSMILSDPETMAVIADFRYYDEAAVDLDYWWYDPDVSTGVLQLETASTNLVTAIYVDRDTVVEVLDYEDEGRTFTATDVELQFGWNLLEHVQIDPDTTQLMVYADGLPSWEMHVD